MRVHISPIWSDSNACRASPSAVLCYRAWWRGCSQETAFSSKALNDFHSACNSFNTKLCFQHKRQTDDLRIFTLSFNIHFYTIWKKIKRKNRRKILTVKCKQDSSCFTKRMFLWLQKEANVPERDCKTLSSDLIEYAQYMIREHNDDFKVRAAAGPEGGFWSFLGEVPRSDGVSTFALKSHSVHNGGNCVHVVLWATKYPTIKRFPPLLKV